MMRAIAATAAVALLGGCAFVPFRRPHHHIAHARPVPVTPADASAPDVAAGAPGACRTDSLRVLERRPGSAVLAAQALELSGARSIRWMHPGDVVTMDFRPDRLTIKLTRENIVKSFACG